MDAVDFDNFNDRGAGDEPDDESTAELFARLGITTGSDVDEDYEFDDDLELKAIVPAEDLVNGDKIKTDEDELMVVRGVSVNGMDVSVNGMLVDTGKPVYESFMIGSTINVYS